MLHLNLPGCVILTALLVFSRAAAVLAAPLEAAVDKLVKKQGVGVDGPGVAILILQPGQPTFKKGYGLANLREKRPITPQTLFELASVSKTFTATATLMLEERGKLSVDDDVRKFLPELPIYQPNRPIRISDLLHHTSGLPDYMDLEDVPARNKGFWVNEDYAKEFARQRKAFPLDFPTGQKYDYNNTNFMLLALIIQRISQKSFGKFMHDEIFVLANMTSTFVYESPQSVPNDRRELCAVGYSKKKKSWNATWGVPPERHETLLTVGDGAIWTNLDDMAQWDMTLREHKLVKESTMTRALEPSKTRDGETNTYGLGWEIFPNDSGGLNGFGHEGSWGGFETSYYRYLLEDRTTVILSNRSTFDPDAFWYKLNDVVEEAGW